MRPNTWQHRPLTQNMKKALAKWEPSTHGDIGDLQRESQRGSGTRLGRQEGALLGITLVLLTFAGCANMYTCIDEGRWGFLIAGSIVSPIGMMHGWFGWW